MGDVIMAWVEGIAGLAIVVMAYSIGMPLISAFVFFTTSLGAPAGMALYLANNAVWAFIILGLACLAYPIIYSWKETYDQGQQQGYR